MQLLLVVIGWLARASTAEESYLGSYQSSLQNDHVCVNGETDCGLYALQMSAKAHQTSGSSIYKGDLKFKQLQSLSQMNSFQVWLATSWMRSDHTKRDAYHGNYRPSSAELEAVPIVLGTGHVMDRRRLGMELAHGRAVDVSNHVDEYANRYLQELKGKVAVFYNHISKACGTTFCQCGWSSQCTAYGKQNEGDNCHARDAMNDIPHWNGGTAGSLAGRPPKYDRCGGQVEYIREHGYTLQGNENYLISDGLCKEFWNVIILRDPIDRLMSHLAHLNRLNETEGQWPEVPLGNMTWAPKRLTPQFIFDTVPILSNNYYVRSLLGEDVFMLPFGGITASHLHEAKRILEQYDLVLLKGPQLIEDIERTLGWKCQSEAKRTGDTGQFMENLNQVWSPADWQLIHQHNQLDIELVKYASTLHWLDKQVLDQPQFVSKIALMEKGKCGYLGK